MDNYWTTIVLSLYMYRSLLPVKFAKMAQIEKQLNMLNDVLSIFNCQPQVEHLWTRIWTLF